MVEFVRAGRSPGELAREFEPAEYTIRKWVQQADRDEGRREDGPTTGEKKKIRRLRREVRQDIWLMERIETAHERSKETYGSPRIHAEIQAKGIPVGRKRVALLMKAWGVVGVSRRKGTRTTVRDESRRPGFAGIGGRLF